MFDASTYAERRRGLLDLADERPLLFPSQPSSPRNYTDNTLPYRQDSHFLWLTGLVGPRLTLCLHAGETVLFGPPEDLDDVVWHGPKPTLAQQALESGLLDVRDESTLGAWLKERSSAGTPRYLPPYHGHTILGLATLLGLTPDEVKKSWDRELAIRMADLRNPKSDEEIALMERALEVTAAQHRRAIEVARPGMTEHELLSAMLQPSLERGLGQAYSPILSVRGEILHNHSHDNVLESGQLVLNDSGVEDASGYASDITRTFPVDPTFTPEQKALYEVCLDSQLRAIEVLGPGVAYADVHRTAARVLAEGLIEHGLMKGKAEDAVDAGAHALFFPHGVGHVIGLDVHDMEDLGDLVGYGDEGVRSDQFGLNFLRLSRRLAPSWIVTIEPGIYFIPALIDRWATDARCAEFIDYDRAKAMIGFGGIRIEDDVLITDVGHRVLGPPIPKSIEDIEALRASTLDAPPPSDA